MKVYTGRIDTMAQEILESVTEEEDIEVLPEMAEEVRLDIASVLREYVRLDREITDRARDVISDRGLPYNQLHKIKYKLAEERGFGIGEDSVDYLSSQIIEMLLHTAHVEEVYAENHDLRRKMRPAMRRHMSMESDLEQEVRNRIKNLQEGTSDWKIEYDKVMEQLKDGKNLN